MFEVTLDKVLLSKILSYVEPTVGKGAQFMSECIEMSTDQNGIMTVNTNNTMEFTSIKVATNANANMYGTAPLVPFRKLKSIVDSISDMDQITLKNLGNSLGIIYSSSANKKPIELTAVQGTMLPVPTVQAQAQISIPRSEFSRAMKYAADITDPNASMPIYSCMRIEQDNDALDFSCIDYTSKRLFSYSAKSNTQISGKMDVLVEVHKLAKALKMFEYAGEVELESDNSNIHLKMSNAAMPNNMSNITDVDYYCRRITGSYPNNITASLTQGCTESAIINVDALEPIIMRIRALDDKTPGSSTVIMDMIKDKLNIKYSTSVGVVDEEVTINNTLNNPMTASFNYKDMFDIIESISKIGNYSAIEIGTLKSNSNYYMVFPSFGPNIVKDSLFAISSVSPANP